jgi:hypothetical protein
MGIGEIIIDSVRYSFSDWKKVLILGIIVLFGTFGYTLESLGFGMLLFGSGVFGVVFVLLIYGYGFRIIGSSLAGFDELPGFGGVFGIVGDGFKVFLVGVGYVVPLFLYFLVIILFIGPIMGLVERGVVAPFVLIAVVLPWLYLIGVFPVFLMSLANMAFYDGSIGAGLKFREIFDKISNIGLGNFVVWFVVTVIVCFGLIFLWGLVVAFFTIFSLKFVGILFGQLIIFPIIIIFLFRSIALIYLSENKGYLVCNKCGGYYQLQQGESPEDFEKCQCGGDLRFSKQLNSKSHKKRNIILGISSLLVAVLLIVSAPYLTTALNNIVGGSQDDGTTAELIGTYNASDIDDDPYGAVIVLPPGTKKVKIEYDLSKTPTDKNGITIKGYNTNVTAGMDLLYFNDNMIYYKYLQLIKDDQNESGSRIIERTGLKSLYISTNGVEGTIKVYAYKQ